MQSVDARGSFWEALGVPVFCNVLCATRDEALNVPRGDIRLAFEPESALITNVAFDASRMDYDVCYENSLHFSPRFREYADGLAQRLIDQYNLHGKTILEIACGQGDFLHALCEGGGNQGIGFDPAHDPSDAPMSQRMNFVRDYYGPKYADQHADFICCRHALEHIPDPVAFLVDLRQTLGERSDAVVFFEVPNGLYTLREMGIWDLIYEHCTYFVAPSLRYCFEHAGFEVLGVSEEYDGQFLTIIAKPAGIDACVMTDTSDEIQKVSADVARFADAYRAKVVDWSARINALRTTGRRAVVWGSGSKGVTFLNILRPGDAIEEVVDINPRKQGKFVAGTGQRIVAPEHLRTNPPGAVIVMNAIYLDEIRQTLNDLGVDAEVLVA